MLGLAILQAWNRPHERGYRNANDTPHGLQRVSRPAFAVCGPEMLRTRGKRDAGAHAPLSEMLATRHPGAAQSHAGQKPPIHRAVAGFSGAARGASAVRVAGAHTSSHTGA